MSNPDPVPVDPTPSGDPTPVDPAPAEPKPFFSEMPDDWRNQAVALTGLEPGEDFDKRVGQMERHTDMASVLKSGFEAQDKIRKGEISTGLPENATDEQLSAYREANGIPTEASAYELSLDEGLVLGEADGRIMEGVYEFAHGENIPTKAMSGMTNAYLKGREAEKEAMVAQDGIDKQTVDRQLKEAWGNDYAKNVNMVQGLINQLPETVVEGFKNARMEGGGGKGVFNSPEIVIAMADWARKINPAATVVPNSDNPMQTMNEKIAAYEKRMGEDSVAWHKDKAAHKDYMDLITARDQMRDEK